MKKREIKKRYIELITKTEELEKELNEEPREEFYNNYFSYQDTLYRKAYIKNKLDMLYEEIDLLRNEVTDSEK